jgi:hypothetical protein
LLPYRARERALAQQSDLAALTYAAACSTVLQMRNKTRIIAARQDDAVRITATVSREQERRLKSLATRNKVSLAWLVREAIDRLLAEPQPPCPLDSKEAKQ